MSLQVNLLKKTERRYQGIVSMKVILLGSGSLFAAITILAYLLAVISKMTLNSELDHARNEWARLEPSVVALRATQAAIESNNKTLSAIERWSKDIQPSMYSILRAVQKNVPAQMALYHFSASMEQDGEDHADYVLRMSGTANGELTAVAAKRQLSDDAKLSGFYGEIKLVSSQRHFGEAWAFALEGRRLADRTKD